MHEKVSCIILNYNGEKFLKSLIPSIYSQTFLPYEIILVDNASSDKSVDWARNNFPDVRLIVNPKNLYFSKGMNEGIKRAKGDYVLCLNNDLKLDREFLEKLLSHINLSKDIGMACGKIYDWEGEKIDSCGQEISMWGSPRDRGKGKREGFEKTEEVFGPGGIAALYKKEMLEDIKEGENYFDEKMKIFYEDLDLAWRARRKGWKCIFVPSAKAFHYRGGTTLRKRVKGPLFIYLSPYFKEQIILNRLRTWRKNSTMKEFLSHLPFYFIYEFFLFLFLFISSPLHAKETLLKVLKNV